MILYRIYKILFYIEYYAKYVKETHKKFFFWNLKYF